MKKSIILFSLLALLFGLGAKGCDTTEMTSARLYIQQNNYPKAKEQLQKAIDKDAKNAEAYYLLGFIYGEQDSIDQMINNFDKSLAINKEYADKIQESRRYHWAQNFNKGVNYFNKASQTTSEDSIAMYYDKAINAFEAGIELQPDSAGTYKNLAFAYINMGQAEEAVPSLEKVLELEPSAETYKQIGQIYTDQAAEQWNLYKNTNNPEDSVNALANYDKVIVLMKDAREEYPNNSDLLLLLSNAYVAANRLDEAMASFKAGVENEPGNKFYRYNYGVLLLGAEKYEEAAEQFKSAVDLDPEYTNAIYNLAVTYVRWGAKIREQEEAQLEDPSMEVSDAYKEKFELALPNLEKYLEMKPDEPAVWELLGRVYANLGMTEKSQKAFETADMYR